MRTGLFVAAVALLLSSSVAARADYVYTVTINDIGYDSSFYNGSFTFDESSILTSNTVITDLTVSPGSPDITSVTINPTGNTCTGITPYTATGRRHA